MKERTDAVTGGRRDTEIERVAVAVCAQIPVSPRLRFSPSLFSVRLHP